ncbi:hypothetical protein TSAR_010792 [Trichomalopsis sarcophagae]|uniref:Uncharacterized protein n=1 Tax=Trichomalopsis sarcophagae TaxID=543379 RepID=A0A232FGH0_9HYME|nr:hypothetical protein TSAR_010792 [Trichomalopsis sarcophagae]
MARATRSRQAPVSVNPETESKRSMRKTSTGKTTAGRVTRKNLNGKSVSDENSSSPTKTGKVSKNTQTKASVLRSKLHVSKKDDSSQGNTLMAMKSPVLRDRTNTTNELVKTDASAKKTEEMNSDNNKKLIKATKSTKVTKGNAKQSNEVQMSMEKFVVKKQKVQIENTKEKSADKSEEVAVNKKHTIGSTFSRIVSQKNSKVKKSVKDAEPSDSESNGENQDSLSNKNVQSQSESPNTNRVLRRKNISIEAVEQLLNEDEEIDVESDKKVSQRKSSKVDKIVNNVVAEAGEENKKNNKFFKNKGVEEQIKTVPVVKKTLRGKTNKRKKIKDDDSSFSATLEEQRQSTKPPEKKLRPRANKNYCEVSKLSQDSKSNEEKSTDTEKEKDVNKDLKKIPIYKTVKLSEENVKVKDAIYDYLDDSQEDGEQKGKKKKKTVKRPAVKRARKAATVKPAASQKVQKKMANKVPRNVQFKKQSKVPINIQQNIVVNNVQTNIIGMEFPEHFSNAEDNVQNNEDNIALPESSKQIIPEHLLNAGDNTIAEASTIKIVSDQKLEGSKRINLTSTPPVPKTITSELKLFGPRNVITSKPTTKYSNMVNHSLIRQSMSPITKVVENFDTGSPWRAVDAFSRVNRMVQSTPQINRLPSIREKKLPTHLSNLNNMNNLKSINSQDTIHVSSIMEDKSSEKNKNSTPVPTTNQNEVSSKKPAHLSNLNKKSLNSQDTIDISSMMEDSLLDKNSKLLSTPTTNQNKVSPRKFGTVISNLSPAKSANSSNSPVQNIIQSSVQTALSPIASSDIPVDQEDSTIPGIQNKENTLASPTKSPRKKISTPSPFRFERIRTSKRLASMESQNKTPKSTPQKISKEGEPEAGPSSCADKSKSALLRQSNLHNFLNLDEMPESTRISTAHGIFGDVHSTPIAGKKPKRSEEPNIDNAFGFDDYDISETTPIEDKSSVSVIATEQDVRDSVKGKLFPKARVKSMMPSRISENTIKKTLMKNVLVKKTSDKKQPEVFNESDESDFEKENDTTRKDVENNNECRKSAKEVALDAVSFSDTFDILSENGDIESKVPEQIPLFVDLEPVHFTQPPRRSYNKRKRAIYFNTSKEDSESDEEEEKPKSKKKKVSKLNKEENKRMHEWLKNINKTFEEIEHYDLVVE